MEKLPVENTAQKVGLKNKLAFASGDIFGGGSFNIINFLFVPFLTLTVGIPMYWVSVIMLISKVWDGIIDPFIGKISDGKQPGRFGKRRFFMLVCAPILIVATILLFFPFFDGAKISKTANIYRCIVCFPRKKEQPGQADCLINDFLYKQSSY